MTKDEIEAAWVHLPGNAQVAIMGRPRRPDGDRSYEVVDIVRQINRQTDLLELDGDVLHRILEGEIVIALDIE